MHCHYRVIIVPLLAFRAEKREIGDAFLECDRCEKPTLGRGRKSKIWERVDLGN